MLSCIFLVFANVGPLLWGMTYDTLPLEAERWHLFICEDCSWSSNCVMSMLIMKVTAASLEWPKVWRAESSWFVNFRSKAAVTSKWRTDPRRTRLMTYLSLPVDEFGNSPQIIFRGVGYRHLPVLVPRWNVSRYLPIVWKLYFVPVEQH